MDQDVASTLRAWENFYVIVGSAAAALTGLQFVVLTLIAEAGVARGRRESIAAFVAPVVIVAAVAAVFAPTLRHGFVWDDDFNLVSNPHFRGFAPAELRWMATSFHLGHYHPLTWASFGLDYVLWGMDPLGYHLTNLVLHALNGVLVYVLLLRLLLVMHLLLF